MNSNNFVKAIESIENDRNINKDVVIEALKEALTKAFRKQAESPDADVVVDIDDKGNITMVQRYKVVETVEFDELEVSLEDAKRLNPSLELGDYYEEDIDVDELGRAAALIAKNVLKQKIREAEKQAVYDEYIDKLDEMVLGSIESVEDKFIVVNLGKTLAIMPKVAQNPNEHYYEGQKLRVVITEVNKDTKGAQVLVSRSDARLVRRLFEKEVPEIFTGTVEIKAIAREAGERTKMAVFSKNPDVDPIGACIGPRGSRVQVIIEELHGEKIDIFEWSDDVEQLIKNALAPAQILAVVPSPEGKGLLVVVDNDQLSLAIGKKGKNARLAVKLTNSRIDIKTKDELEEKGIDYKQLVFEYAIEQERIKREKAAEELARMKEEQARVIAEREAREQAEETPNIADYMDEVYEEEAETEDRPIEGTMAHQEEVTAAEEKAKEPVAEEVKEEVKEEAKEEVKEEVKPAKRTRKPLQERSDYVSKFEDYAGSSAPVEQKSTKKKKKDEDSDRKARSADIRKDKEYEIKIEYSEEELAEIEEYNASLEEDWDEDIDYDEYDEYYDDEN
ncbi:MAG: transcription termination/antitermination protein NusA [Erysipelotrichaceae bacterium]|nr:transcription termination/antitermination protein NusA [Erysipelotrichaceae bacterium]